MAKFGVGQAMTRTEDFRLLTGQGRYTDDFSLPDQSYAFILRSPFAHAEIKGIDTAAAARAPGVLLVLTGDDVAKDDLGPVPCKHDMNNRDGTPRADTYRPVLAQGRVRHVGDPVALVVAETLNQARDAAELIEVDYEDLPAAVDTYAAAQPGAPLIWDSAPGNICFDWDKGDREAVEAAFAKATRTTSIELINNRVVVNALEPRVALAEHDRSANRTTLYVPSQGVHNLREQLADMIFKVDRSEIRVVSGDVGGGFGMKIFLHPEYPMIVWAARKLGRPVRWTSDRSEGFMADTQGRDNVTKAELAMDDDGHFLALRVTTYANLGAYLSNFGPFIPTGAGTSMLAGLYRTPAIYVNVLGVLTNTVPTDAYRGAGRPEAIYVIERLVDKAAREVGLAPAELRRRNFVTPEELPYSTPLGETYDSGEFTALMEKGMDKADWNGFEARREDARSRGRLRGIGMATYVETCGGGPEETADVRLDENNEKVTIYIGNVSNGQGHETGYKQVMSDRLGLDVDLIEVVQGDSELVPTGLTGGSRALPVGGVAVARVSEAIIEKGRQIAANVMEAAAADIEFSDAMFTVAGTDKTMSLFDVARAARDDGNLPEGISPGLDEEYTQKPEASTYPNGCHICEVEIDPETGIVDIVRYTAVDDFGDVINPLTLAGQVHGGIGQGVGQALLEHTVYDEATGQLISGSLMDYTLPRADDVPSINFSTRNVPCRTNPLGIKGAGEAGAIGAPPSVMNAIVDALEPELGLVNVDMPATAQSVWSLLQTTKAA
ncbi:MAG: xanthine dehydrogenase family protein molybdopterin-binding subunit [Alphaproteobacteria bacterium]